MIHLIWLLPLLNFIGINYNFWTSPVWAYGRTGARKFESYFVYILAGWCSPLLGVLLCLIIEHFPHLAK